MTQDAAGSYSVIVSNSLGTITGLVATVSVARAPEAPFFVQSPASADVYAGTNLALTSIVTGYPTPSLQWRFNSKNIQGATGADYRLPYVYTNAAGNYDVVASNTVGVATSQVAVVTVTLPLWPVVITNTASYGVSVGAPAKLDIAVAGAEPITCRWQLNGTNVPGLEGRRISWEMLGEADSGIYRVVVSNQFGSSYGPEIELRTVPVWAWKPLSYSLPLIQLPLSLTNAISIASGYNHALALKADGTVTGWGDNSRKQLEVSSNATNVVALAAGAYHSLALKADGTVVAWGTNDAGQCTIPAAATNIVAISAGRSHSAALKADGTVLIWGSGSTGLTNIPPSATNVIAIASTSSSVFALRADGSVIVMGSTGFSFPAQATNLVALAAAPDYGVGFRRDGNLFRWGSSPSYPYGTFLSSGETGWDAASGSELILMLHHPETGRIGLNFKYSSTGFDPIPANLTTVMRRGWKPARLAVGYDFCAVLLSSHPLPLLATTNRFAAIDGFTSFNARQCEAPPASGYVWQKDGADASTEARLDFPVLQPSDAGVYRLLSSRSNGETNSADIRLTTVMPATPEFVTQSASQTNAEGANILLSAICKYGVPARWQWRKGGMNISDANGSALSLNAVKFSDAGVYDVVLYNSAGAVTSAPALLVVTAAPPAFVTAPISVTVPNNTPVSFSAALSGSAPMTLQWQLNGAELPGATSATLTVPAADASTAGTYTLVASNSAGARSASAVLQLAGFEPWGLASPGASTPLQATNLLALALGENHALGLLQDGRVISWGSNSCGQSSVPSAATNIVRIAAGTFHSLALRQDGTVLGWGRSSDGQTMPPTGMSNVVGMAAGAMHSVFLLADGTVVGGTGTPEITNAVAVAAGDLHSLALKNDGTVVAWGENSSAQCNVPPEVTNVTAICAGEGFSAALRSDGFVVAWGEFGPTTNLVFQADCASHSYAAAPSASDVRALTVPTEAANIVAISAGKRHIVALREDGVALSWGNNDHGQTDVPELTGSIIGVAAGGDQSAVVYGPAAPVIVQLRTNLTVSAGAPFVLNSGFGARPSASCYWISPENISGGRSFVHFSEPGVTNSGNYTLVVSNTQGTATSMVSVTFFIVPPAITVHPSNQVIAAGGRLLLAGAVSGGQLQYQWQSNGVDLADGGAVSGARSSVLTIDPARTNDSAYYRLVATNEGGFALSSNALVMVLPGNPLGLATDAPQLEWTTGGAMDWVWQTNVTHDGSAAASSGRIYNATNNWIRTSVTGPVSVKFWWKFESVFDRFTFAIDSVVMESGGWDFDWQQLWYHLPEGAHTLEWRVPNKSKLYDWNAVGWLDQVSVESASGVSIAAEPASVTNYAGSSVSFSVSLAGPKPYFYQWQSNGVHIANATNSSCTVANVQSELDTDYRVICWNPVNTVTSLTARAFALASPPAFAQQIYSTRLTRGGSWTIEPKPFGSEPLSLQWQLNRSDIPGATNRTFIITDADFEDAGLYRVIARNALGTAYSIESEVALGPIAIWGAQNPYVNMGGIQTWEFGAVKSVSAGQQHALALGKNGRVSMGGILDTFGTSMPLPSDLLSEISSGSDVCMGLTSDGRGVSWGPYSVPYMQSATNLVAISAGDGHFLGLTRSGDVRGWSMNPGSLTEAPAGLSNVVAIAAGLWHNLALKDDGTVVGWGDNTYGQLNIPSFSGEVIALDAYYRTSMALLDDGRIVAWGDNAPIVSVPETANQIVAMSIGFSHALALKTDGQVVAWGTGAGTNVTSGLMDPIAIAAGFGFSVALLSDGSPAITVQPFHRKFVRRAGDRIHARAAGRPPLRYQWQLNGQNIPGATAASLPVGDFSEPGLCRVVVSNDLGSAVSSPCEVVPLFRANMNHVRMGMDGFHALFSGLIPDRPIIIYASSNFTSWTALQTNLCLSSIYEYVDTNAWSHAQRFYKALQPGPLGPLMVQPAGVTALGFSLRVSGASGLRPVTLQTSTNLVDWTPVYTNEPVWDGFEFVDPGASSNGMRFYRVSE